MPINGLNIGKDVTVVINTANGVQRFSFITGFNANPVTGDLKSTGMDGETRHGITHDGWEGELDFDRDSDGFDSFWAQLEDDYHNGKDQPTGSISETITEPKGGVSRYRYTKVVFKLKTLGDKRGNELIKGKLGFFATRRLNAA